MNYETIEQLKDSDFKRLTGVQRETFNQMFAVIEKGLRTFGRSPKLSRANQLLMTLMYWRECGASQKAKNGIAVAKRSATLKKRM